MQHKKVKKKDKVKMHTLLKLIGRTGIRKIQQGNWNARILLTI